MNLTKIAIAAITIFVTNNTLANDTYAQLGVSNVQIEKEKSWDSDTSTFNLILGYQLSNNLSLELGGSIPFSKDVVEKHDDFIFDKESKTNIIDETYEDTVKLSYLTNVNLKLDIPMHKNFDFFIDLGYTYGKLKYNQYYNQSDFTFVDTLADTENASMHNDPANFTCLMTGNEDSCQTPIQELKTEYSGAGFTYGGGFRFLYDNDTAINFTYKRMSLDDDIKVNAISVYYQTFF